MGIFNVLGQVFKQPGMSTSIVSKVDCMPGAAYNHGNSTLLNVGLHCTCTNHGHSVQVTSSTKTRGFFFPFISNNNVTRLPFPFLGRQMSQVAENSFMLSVQCSAFKGKRDFQGNFSTRTRKPTMRERLRPRGVQTTSLQYKSFTTLMFSREKRLM